MHSSSEHWEVGLGLVVMIGFLWLIFRRVWSRYTSKGRLFWLLGFIFLAMASMSAPSFTAPSSAQRITATGQLWNVERIPLGKTYFNEFTLKNMDGTSIFLQTPIDPIKQGQDGPYIQAGETARVTYLNEQRVDGRQPRAIRIEVLDGPYAGWHASVDANWFGVWLLLRIGIVGLLVSMWFATKNLSSAERKHVGEKTSGITSEEPL